MFNLLYHANTVEGAIGGLLALLGAVWLYLKKIRVKWREFRAKLDNFYDAVAGADAIVDPETGRVLKAERLAIGSRVAVIEEWQAQTIHTLQQIANTQAQLTEHQGQLTRVDERVTELVDIVQRNKAEMDKRFIEFGEAEAEQRSQLWQALHKISDE
jgi:uncharacterized coiled-coil protein SlyX